MCQSWLAFEFRMTEDWAEGLVILRVLSPSHVPFPKLRATGDDVAWRGLRGFTKGLGGPGDLGIGNFGNTFELGCIVAEFGDQGADSLGIARLPRLREGGRGEAVCEW